jgi:succinate dehydrogenase / fumarate reductase flavoprotein subunit
MGGVACDVNGATPLPGLYAAGECACVSVHGANRLGGNSLLETVVFGRRAGKAMAEFVKDSGAGTGKEEVRRVLERDEKRIAALFARDSGTAMADIRSRMKKVMFRDFGVFRNKDAMEHGLSELLAVKKEVGEIYFDNRNPVFNLALQSALELEGMVLVAEAIARGSLAREESRGSHFRTDFTERNDERFLAHTVARLGDSDARGIDAVELEYAPVTPGRFPVKERVY